MGQMALPCQMQLVMESLVPSNGILRPRIQKREESGLKEDVSEDVKGEECSGSQLMKVLDDHPVYLETFMNTLSLILKGDGPLPFNYRRYLAIMASARHQSLVLVRSQMAAFSSVGGNQEWLCGLHAAPGKLCSISELNRILAHRPWILSSQHIQNLMKGSWSLSEVVHAIVIMLHFHALSSLVHGTGIEQHLISPSSADPNPLPPPPSRFITNVLF
ncbi:unnamed protein product [Darwinula stevensoni]|uniref:Uncharacterized protein n=1 Tax=Darwinula stevensoni TaxID=69355 RepID=A0A7R9A5G0_9CRUS|nr:unnamed protein product [Darwinula stevensoni]CAG0894323.1 unnamed protein product [Darwinula stevensoni]